MTRVWSSNGSLGLCVDPSHHLNHLECTSFDPMSAEHGSTIAAALIPLLSVQVHVVENEGDPPQTSDAPLVIRNVLRGLVSFETDSHP